MINMHRYRKFEFKTAVLDFLKNLLPNSCDNLKQICLKIFFLVVITGIAISGTYFGIYYGNQLKQERYLNAQREIFKNTDSVTAQIKMRTENNDYIAWLKLDGTKLDNPIFKTSNNTYYLNHNGAKQSSRYGALFFDYRCENGDRNRVIYGHSLKNGSMFGTLDNLRTLSFYKEHSLLNLTEGDKSTDYKIYAVLVLNSSKKDDGGYVYNIYRNEFLVEEDFEIWVDEAKQRSVINTGVDVGSQDKILTLVTECEDFHNARLVIMARSERDGEVLSNKATEATVNSKPKYPKKWYNERNINYPF